jgi:copper transport protein
VLVLTSSPASAHAALLQTTPGDAEILAQSPAEVTLTFGEAVGTGLGSMQVLTDQGARVDTGQISETDGGSKVHLALKPHLCEGTFVVVWRVVSADSHPASGTFTFSVGKPSLAAKNLLGRGNLTQLTSAPRAPGIDLGLTRLAGFAVLVLLLGGALFSLFLWPGVGAGGRTVESLKSPPTSYAATASRSPSTPNTSPWATTRTSTSSSLPKAYGQSRWRSASTTRTAIRAHRHSPSGS